MSPRKTLRAYKESLEVFLTPLALRVDEEGLRLRHEVRGVLQILYLVENVPGAMTRERMLSTTNRCEKLLAEFRSKAIT